MPFTFVLTDYIIDSIFLTLIFIIWCIWLLESKLSPISVTISFVIAALFLQFFTKIDLYSYLIDKPIYTIIGLLSYLVIGIVYVYLKWYSFNKTAARRYQAWLKANEQRVFTSDAYKHSVAADTLRYRSIPIKVSLYKEMIFGWMIYWPISAIWTLLNDPVYHLYHMIYTHIAKSLQRISDRAFGEK